jgi:hypothetical protein
MNKNFYIFNSFVNTDFGEAAVVELLLQQAKAAGLTIQWGYHLMWFFLHFVFSV